MERAKYQIFLSSTFEDLKKERDVIIKAVLEMGHIPVGMELFSAGDEEQWELIKRQIDDCDYYVIVIAHRYGSKDKGVSYTEKEYDYAVSKKIPVLGFILDENVEWAPTFMDTAADDRESLSRLKAKVKQKTVQFWKSADDLHAKVAISLSKSFTTHPRPGWIRATEDVTTGVMTELSRLSKENNSLREQLREAETRLKTDEKAQIESVVQILHKTQRAVSLFFKGASNWEQVPDVSLHRIFFMAAPFLAVEYDVKRLNLTLGNMLWLRLKAETGDQRTSTLRDENPLPINKMHDWLSDLMALNLVQPSKQKHAVSDKEHYWTLTDFGRNVQAELRVAAILASENSQSGAADDEPQ